MEIINSHFRIIDANANRAREGLRVIEEYSRFILNSDTLTQKIKNVRHDFCKAINGFEEKCNVGLSDFRDTAGDVGTSLSTDTERSRMNSREVVKAAIKRLEEAIRSIEEYSKISDQSSSITFEQIRYTVYDVEKEIFTNHRLKKKLSSAKLYVLVTEELASASSEIVVREALAGGADIIQMREKKIEDKEFYQRAEILNKLCKDYGAIFLLNDRPHIAALIDADGIHTGQGDLPISLCRKILGPNKIIGKSTSAPEILTAAIMDGADYVGVGPVFETNTKKHRAPVGLEYVNYAVKNSQIPYFPIGSINRQTISEVISAGAKTVAICTAIINAKDIANETAWFKKQLEE